MGQTKVDCLAVDQNVDELCIRLSNTIAFAS